MVACAENAVQKPKFILYLTEEQWFLWGLMIMRQGEGDIVIFVERFCACSRSDFEATMDLFCAANIARLVRSSPYKVYRTVVNMDRYAVVDKGDDPTLLGLKRLKQVKGFGRPRGIVRPAINLPARAEEAPRQRIAVANRVEVVRRPRH